MRHINQYLKSATPLAKAQILKQTVLVTCVSVALVGCFGNDDDNLIVIPPATTNDSKLVEDPVMTKTFTATELKNTLNAAGYTYIDEPVCGITVHYMNHTTMGVANEPTNATGAVVMPNGDASQCQGERPITLYAHGTNSDKSYNLAALDDPSNPAYGKSLYIAATFAGQGDIIVAPNYPGYDKSTLDYIPYNTAKQGEQMVDALYAGKLAIEKVNKAVTTKKATYGDKLFVTGFSQGGYVTMAAAKALEEAGIAATALSPSSGAYAMTAFADSIMSGNVIAGGTYFLPMLTASYTKEYQASNPNLFDGIYTSKYAQASSLFPTTGPVSDLFTTGKLPVSFIFQSNPTGYPSLDSLSPPNPKLAFGFDSSDYLFDTDFRAKYVADMTMYPDSSYPTFTGTGDMPTQSNNDFRKVFMKNDLRNYKPTAPVLLCGGNQDPSVTFDVNSGTQAQIWKNNASTKFAMVDMDITNQTERAAKGKVSYISTLPAVIDNTVSIASKQLQQDFSQSLQTLLTNTYQVAYTNAINAGKSNAEAIGSAQIASYTALLSNYHGKVDSYCVSAANTFFAQYR